MVDQAVGNGNLLRIDEVRELLIALVNIQISR